MHNLNVLILGPPSFISTLDELKTFFKFNLLLENSKKEPNILLFHVNILSNKVKKDFIDKNKCIKICAGKKNDFLEHYDSTLEFPTTLKEINIIIENAAAKKKFNINSSIAVKNYLLNKNEKKLSKINNFIILTEKEVQLLELLLNSNKPISKNNILSTVWNYSSDADTHTVETHIYRLRKKIAERFMDQNFILNNKDGYYL